MNPLLNEPKITSKGKITLGQTLTRQQNKGLFKGEEQGEAGAGGERGVLKSIKKSKILK